MWIKSAKGVLVSQILMLKHSEAHEDGQTSLLGLSVMLDKKKIKKPNRTDESFIPHCQVNLQVMNRRPKNLFVYVQMSSGCLLTQEPGYLLTLVLPVHPSTLEPPLHPSTLELAVHPVTLEPSHLLTLEPGHPLTLVCWQELL